jgi:Fe-S cluster assembly protein SufD
MSEVMQSKNDVLNSNGFEGVLADELKIKALKVLETLDFPTSRDEAWKYTRLGKISNKKFTVQPAELADVSAYKMVDNAYNLVFINGFLSKEHSDSTALAGVELMTVDLAQMSDFKSHVGKNIPLEGEIFNALNTAYATGGVCVKILANTVLEKPIQLIHIQTGERVISNVRHVIVCEKNAQAEIIQGYFSKDATETFSNIVTEVFVGENSHLAIQKIQYEGDTCYQIATEQVSQERNATFTINTITLNGALVRNNLNIAVDGKNGVSNLNGAYLLKDKQHIDNHTIVDHKVPHCESHELYKGVMDEKSTAVFNGKVFVRKDAQKINAFQSNANVLLSDDATVNSKPELEIYADDVKCSHGSTTGQLDEEAVFYLRSRGISELSARKLIVSAFINDVIEKIENEDLKKYVFKLLNERFGWEF